MRKRIKRRIKSYKAQRVFAQPFSKGWRDLIFKEKKGKIEGYYKIDNNVFLFFPCEKGERMAAQESHRNETAAVTRCMEG